MMPKITLRSCLAGIPGRVPYVREAIKLTLRSWLHRSSTRNWLRHLNSNPAFGELVASCPRLILKIYRPYLSNTMTCKQRLGLLMAHYHFVFMNGLGPIVTQAARGAVVLARFSGKSGAEYQIQLRAIDIFEREGDLILQLTCGGQLIYSVVFSFFQGEQAPVVGIGCMQGPRGEGGLELIREATRDLHGLRPKNLLVRLVRQLGHDFGCRKLILVGNRNRTVRSATRQGKVHADYDSVWQEMGARARANGDFELASENLPAPVMEDIPSKKRSEVRKRHAMLETLLRSVQTCLMAARGDSLPAMAPALMAPPGMGLEVPPRNSALPLAPEADRTGWGQPGLASMAAEERQLAPRRHAAFGSRAY